MSRHSLLNSFLLSACLAVTGWVAKKAADSAEQIAAIHPTLDAMKETNSRVERKLDDTISRREFDARVLVIETEQRKQDIHLREIDLEIVKLKQR